MMTVERVTVAFVQETLKGFTDHMMDQGDEDIAEYDEDRITQGMIDEMNADITGGNIKEGSASSYVPKTIFEVLADEEILDEKYEEQFIAWFEEQHA